MWKPTHVKVTVHTARHLIAKGRGGSNNVYTTIQMGKEKFQTSVKEKTVNPVWHEECDLSITDENVNIILTVFHHNAFGIDEFLGQIVLPLSGFDVYDKPMRRFYLLKCKSDKVDDKYRGDLEVEVSFAVHDVAQGTPEISKKRKGSIRNIASTVGHKLQKFPARSLSLRLDHFDPRHHLEKLKERRHSSSVDKQTNKSKDKEGSLENELNNGFDRETVSLKNENIDAENTSHIDSLSYLHSSRYLVGSTASLEVSQTQLENTTHMNDHDLTHTTCTSIPPPSYDKYIAEDPVSFFETSNNKWSSNLGSQLKGKHLAKSEGNLWQKTFETKSGNDKKSKLQMIRNSLRRHTVHIPDSMDDLSYGSAEDLTSGKESRPQLSLIPESASRELSLEYDKMTHKELVALIINQQMLLDHQKDKISDLELYIDNLLVRVMETSPRILQTPYKPFNPACHR